MHTVVVGGTGHISSYLVPRLVAAGHEVTVLSRGQRSPYAVGDPWPGVRTVEVDRQAEDEAGTFGARVAALRPDVVVDLICFTPESSRQLTDALAGRVGHLLHCGSIWAHGAARMVPTTEDMPRRPITAYGEGKVAIEAELLAGSRDGGVPATVVHPGHISGPGWAPINPAGHLDLGVFEALATGATLTLPDQGLARLQHVHASDVADVFLAAIDHREAAVGESFHAVADGAMTLVGYAEAAAAWWGREAVLDFAPFDRWCEGVDADQAATTRDHVDHSPCCSMAKVADVLGFRPRYRAIEAAGDAVRALVAEGRLPEAVGL